MGYQRLTTSEVEAVTHHLPGGAARARLLEEKDRNQVFAVGEQAIFKAYLSDGRAKQARKIAALEFLAGCGLPVPRLLGHGVLASGPGEHCLGILGWASQGCPGYFAQALWLIEQVLDGARVRLA